MEDKIKQELAKLEKFHDIKIVYAAETGSRLYGYATATSDYDVRFLFKRKIKDYVRVDVLPDAIVESTSDQQVEFQGWDIIKALQLFRKSNGSLYELLTSDIIYNGGSSFGTELQALIPTSFSQKRLGYHYLRMSMKNRKSEEKKNGTKRLKMMLHSVRSLLATLYIEQYGDMPPTDLDRLIRSVKAPNEVKEAVQQLIIIKREGKSEPGRYVYEILEEYLDHQHTRLSNLNFKDEQISKRKLNAILHKELNLE